MAFAGAALSAGLSFAAPASAKPDCVATSPTTTQCQTPGHTQIVTSPPAMNGNAWWPYGGFAIGFPR